MTIPQWALLARPPGVCAIERRGFDAIRVLLHSSDGDACNGYIRGDFSGGFMNNADVCFGWKADISGRSLGHSESRRSPARPSVR